MRKKSLVVSSVVTETEVKLDKIDDSPDSPFLKDSNDSYTTSTSDSPPLTEGNASITPECETTISEINGVAPSTLTKSEKLSSPALSSTVDEAHDDPTENTTTPLATTLSSPSTDNQALNNPTTPAATSPTLLPQPQPQQMEHNHDELTEIKPTLPMDTSLPSSASEASPVSPANTILPTKAQDDSPAIAAAGTFPVLSNIEGIPDDLASTSSTTTATDAQAPPSSTGGGKVKRKKRRPYQTPTEDQLNSLVNGHLNDKLSISAAARRAGIARSTASSLMKKHKTTGSIPERQPRGRTAPAKIQAEQAAWIDQYLIDHESATLEKIRVALLVAFPSINQISLSGLQRNITLKCTRHLKRRRQSKNADDS
ncbi:hypothetical protein BCR42DRAFT_421673 [Absidia repens]|uniref:Uncharacterized protein n=1 Tax=Absidia repens TaxID=90262 RepID=A0A1X2I7Z4_9FUNG|nr:hypothetical protein BCR42DRAFT_421673 [Absidia repens]